jgi:selenide,water dikinase
MDPSSEKIYLTTYSKAAGCGCKIAPAVLQEILSTDSSLPVSQSLLVGYHTNDDAAVYLWNEEEAIVCTTDFFAPVVDDAFDFGRIAAANAISDVYAMGASPLIALAILGWPVEQLSPSLAKQVLEGARSICREAGIPLAGGHSIDAKEPFFGLSVNGRIAVENIKQNNTAKEGDVLFLTKPIGVGILTTAEKRKLLMPEHEEIAIKQMVALNRIGRELALLKGVHAMTDVTGFGLLGHLIEMAEGSGLSVDLQYGTIPVIDCVKQYLAQRIVPDATYRNWNFYQSKTKFATGVNVMEAFQLLPDPQTNGGLLIAVDPSSVNQIQDLFEAYELSDLKEPIGICTSKKEAVIYVNA